MISKLSFEKRKFIAADIGPENSLPSISKFGDADLGFCSRLDETDGLYVGYGMITDIFPYRMQDLYNRDKREREFTVAILENDHIKATFAPELGGKLLSLFDKDTSRELLFDNCVLQPCNLALRNAWMSGGVEWNIGMVGHTPFTCSPIFTAKLTDTDGTPILRMYEYERIRKVTYQMDFYIPEDSKLLYCRMRIVNPNTEVTPMYWWSNIAVPEDKDSRVIPSVCETDACAYTSEVIDGNRIVFKLPIPECEGFDATYPVNTADRSRDYFYRTDDNKRRYIAYVDKEGYGLMQTSTSLLKGRKLFVWGQGSGAAHWKDFLSIPGKGNYVEIQAGLARSQYEHLPMPPQSAWEWVEVYGAIQCDADKAHGNFNTAQTEIEKQIAGIINEEELEKELISSKKRFALKKADEIVISGSGWGKLADKLRVMSGSPSLSEHLDFGETTIAQNAWLSLLENGTVGEHCVDEVPQSWMMQKEFTELLEKAVKDKDINNWYAWLQLGVIKLIEGKTDEAFDALLTSDKCSENAWARYCLAVISLRRGNKIDAANFALSTVIIKSDDVSLVKGVMSVLNKTSKYKEVISLYNDIDVEIKKNSRVGIEFIYALAHSGEYETALELLTENGGYVLDDVKEEETILSDIYAYLVTEIAKIKGETLDMIHIPEQIDFRVKPEDLKV